MKLEQIKLNHLILLAVVVAMALFYFKGVRAMVSGSTRAAVNVVGGAAEGVIHGTSDIIGLPTPERSKCEQAKLDGSKWDVSFYCPVGEFLSFAFEE
ncbi:MAG: hypothetical protein IBX55_15900 [Methyloprofundus sp.]|nr:hypothetical protein [Methyloprofundus sp.]